MKILVDQKDGEGLEALLGENVFIMCACYIYAGRLVGVNTNDIKLEDVSIVYETGQWSDKNWKDAQKLPGKFHYIRTGMIESYGAK